MRTKRPTPSSSSQDCEAQKEFAFKKLGAAGEQLSIDRTGDWCVCGTQQNDGMTLNRRSPGKPRPGPAAASGEDGRDLPRMLRRSTSETDVSSRRSTRLRCQVQQSDEEDDGDADKWVVADPCSPDFGQEYADVKAIAEMGVTSGEYCLVPSMRSSGGSADSSVFILKLVRSRAQFKREFYQQARPQIAELEADLRIKTPAADDKRTDERREELSHWDMVAKRPALKAHRVLFAVMIFTLLAAAVWATYDEGNVSIVAPILVTVLYPMGLFAASRVMTERQPAGDYVFELLLVFDVYHLVSSMIIFALVLLEASHLSMLLPPIGHTAAVSSSRLRLLIWWHYCNRIFELLDTIFRITQKKLQAYGALHFYLRLVSVWSWYAATCVGGGDVWFLLVWDTLVVSVRFFVFTLSVLQWNFNFQIDFGLHAPKLLIFRKDQLFRLQV